VTDDELKQRHLVLIGRPGANSVATRFRENLPVSFGSHSFELRGEAYAHRDTAVLVAAENPLNRRFSMVVVAGLSAQATMRAAPQLGVEGLSYAEVIVLQHGDVERGMIVAPNSLTREIEP
jgi:hypothetical protein